VVVLILTACPVGLRGHVTRWLLEISPGVFVGKVSTRVRDELWQRVLELVKDGRALMVFSRRGEQGLSFRVHRHDWEPCDFDGLALIRRPDGETTSLPTGWSRASKLRLAARARK
jgi:CRISPR-associated protein Cas2